MKSTPLSQLGPVQPGHKSVPFATLISFLKLGQQHRQRNNAQESTTHAITIIAFSYANGQGPAVLLPKDSQLITDFYAAESTR